MGGVLSHTLVGLLSGLAIYYVWRKPEFSLSTFVGNTAVDSFKFVFSAIKQGAFSIFSVEQDSTYWLIAGVTQSWANWMIFGFFALAFFALLYHHHIIRRKTMYEYDELVWAFLFGVTLHLILDGFYDETNLWL